MYKSEVSLMYKSEVSLMYQDKERGTSRLINYLGHFWHKNHKKNAPATDVYTITAEDFYQTSIHEAGAKSL